MTTILLSIITILASFMTVLISIGFWNFKKFVSQTDKLTIDVAEIKILIHELIKKELEHLKNKFEEHLKNHK